ncbi:MAG TPA: carboxymuconolactone decarboxylase family protein [Moraxellaceae bacterium]|nr:carboxymuconolactone decarboxylase family protein [Moraxellaceae bacterium]
MASLQDLLPPGGWRTPGYTRLPPLDAANAGLGRRLVMHGIRRIGQLDAANLWLLLMHNVRLLRGFLAFAPALMPFGALPRKDTELVILRVAWNCRAYYEWGQHVDMALRNGLSPADIVRIAEGAEAPGWSDRQQALLRTADELHRERMVSEATWQALTRFLDEALLLELLMLIGFYESLAGVLNSTGLPLDKTPNRHVARVTPLPRQK